MATIVPQQIKDVLEGWTKWEIATAVGAPIALGLAGLWWYNRSKNSDGKPGKKPSDKAGGDSSEPLSISTSAPPGKVQGRQELAQQAKNKGNKFFKDGQYEDAIICYTEAITTCPPDIKTDMSTFYQNRAAAHENMKQYPLVIKDCDSALDLNPKYSKALARRSKAKEHLDKFRESLEDITKACLIESFQNQTYLQAADRVLKSLGKTRAATEYKVKKATDPSSFYIKNYLAGFINDPVTLGFTDSDLSDMGVKMKEPDNIGDNGAVLLEKPSGFEGAKVCLLSGEYSQIIGLCDQELSIPDSPHKAEAFLLRGTMKLLQGMGDGATQDLEAVIGLEGVAVNVQASALIRCGSLKMQREASDDSLSYFNQAESVAPLNSDVFHHHGQQLLQLEQLDEAISKFDKSIELSPKFPTSYVQKYYAVHRKAIVKEDLKLLTQAKEGFETTIERFPDCSDALILYAQALSDQGKFEDAEKIFKKAQEVQPSNANNVVHRGLMTLQWKGDVQQTLKLLEEALTIDPTCQYAYEIRGTIEVQRGNLSDAVKSFKQAIALSNSENEMAHLFSLMEAAEVQVKVAKDLKIQLPSAMM